MRYPNGTSAEYAYDAAGRLAGITHNGASGAFDGFSYTFDKVGSIVGMDRLLSAGTRGSTDTGAAAYDAANRLLTLNNQPVTHDLNGNMTSITDNCGTTTYAWDERNRLAGVNGFKPDCTPVTASFTYDGVGRRIAKTIDEVTTKYLYDGWDVVQEIQDSQVRARQAYGSSSWDVVQEIQDSQVKANYLRTLNIDEPLVRISFDGTTEYYHADRLGSITALTDKDGNPITWYAYSPFGESTMTGTQSDNPLQYTARENDGTGLDDYRNRYYNPKLGRFISEDPIGFAGGVNFYAYVGNSPMNWIDSLGLAVLNPNNHIIFPAVQQSLEKFNDYIGQDKDVVITGGNRPAASNLGAGAKSTHVESIAADIIVPNQSHLQTANQADDSGLFGGVGWYEEGYRGPNGEGPHVHVDLRENGPARWGFDKSGNKFRGTFPAYKCGK